MSGQRPVVIVGAGIAGLTLSLCLARAGFHVELLERAAELKEVGAGLQLSPNATNILLSLGLGSALDATGVRPEAVVVREAVSGASLVRMPLGDAMVSRYGAPYIVIHRGDLQQVLYAAVENEPRVHLVLGAEPVAFRATEEGVEVDYVVSGEPATARGAVLVGADGVHSWVRREVMGGGDAVYSGRTAWRATVSADDWAEAETYAEDSNLWLGARAHLVHYGIDAGRAVNIVAVIDDEWTEKSWDVPGDPAQVAAVFSDWPKTVRDLVAVPEVWRKWALCGAPSGTPWVEGNVVLVGDAVHAMLPFVAQGAAVAIEDARMLASALATDDLPMDGRLERYAELRRPRADAVVAMARRNGSIYHWGGLTARARNLVMRIAGPDRLMHAMDWIYGWRPEDI
jgi:salicylate hydroxylase